MQTFIDDIRKSLASEIWTTALQGALALPDICAALESPTGRTSGAQYRQWFSTYMGPRYAMLDPEDCWRLRCGMVHQGRTASNNYDRILFTAPPMVMHANIINGGLNLDIITFCEDMCDVVERWFHVSASSEPVRANLQGLVQWHQDGLAPYIEGYPVLA